MVDCIAEKIFPQLSIENGANGKPASNSNACVQLISIQEGDKTVSLPSLAVEQNYSQMLSELVMHI